MIKIAEYGIAADEHCYIYGKVKTQKIKDSDQTKEVIVSPRYCGTIQDCLDGIARCKQREVVQSLDCDLKSAVQAIIASNLEYKIEIQKVMAGTCEAQP